MAGYLDVGQDQRQLLDLVFGSRGVGNPGIIPPAAFQGKFERF